MYNRLLIYLYVLEIKGLYMSIESKDKKNSFFIGWNLLGTVSLIIAILTGVGIPVWQNYWVNVSNLKVEINSISRDVEPNIGIRLNSHIDLKLLLNEAETEAQRGIKFRKYISDSDYFDEYLNVKTKKLNKNDLETLISNLKIVKENLPGKIDSTKELINKVENLTTENASSILDELSYSSFSRYRTIIDLQISDSKSDSVLDSVKKELKEKYASKLAKYENRLQDLQLNLNDAESKAYELLEEVTKKESYFTVNAVLINSGKASISIKKPALLRVYVGTGTYIDVNLELDEYSANAEVAANGTKIVKLKSKRISTFLDEDQKLIDTYWGQSVHAILFVQDLNGYTLASNRIPFTEGLYQKVIFDKLSEEASNPKYFKQYP